MMVRRLVIGAGIICGCIGAAAQSPAPIRLYVDEPSSSTSPHDYAIDIDGSVVTAASLTRGPQSLSAIVLYDTSDSVRPGSLDSITRRIAGWVRPADTVRIATFADRILVGSTPIIDRTSAAKAAPGRRPASRRPGRAPRH